MISVLLLPNLEKPYEGSLYGVTFSLSFDNENIIDLGLNIASPNALRLHRMISLTKIIIYL